jgi:hypothetical protein
VIAGLDREKRDLERDLERRNLENRNTLQMMASLQESHQQQVVRVRSRWRAPLALCWRPCVMRRAQACPPALCGRLTGRVQVEVFMNRITFLESKITPCEEEAAQAARLREELEAKQQECADL